MTAHLRVSVPAAIAVAFVVGCSDAPRHPTEPPLSIGSSAARQGITPQMLDEQWAQVALAEVPGFAGVVRAADGADEVMLADPSRQSQAEAYIRSVRKANGQPDAPIRIRAASHPFDKLMSWRLQLLQYLGTQGIHLLDINELQIASSSA